MKRKIIYQQAAIFYSVLGQGQPVMLIHGFAEDGAIWNNCINHLVEENKILIPDLPGSGQSEMLQDMSMENIATLLKAIAEHELADANTFQKIALIGHSMGGYAALAFAEKFPEQLSGLGLFHSTAFADSNDKKNTRLKGIEFIQQHGTFEFLKTTSSNLFSPKTKIESPSIIDNHISGLGSFSAKTLVSYYNAMMVRPDRTKVLETCRVPVLFIMGKDDIAAPIYDILKQCQLPEIAYIHILSLSGHMGMLEEPNMANFYLSNFLLSI